MPGSVGSAAGVSTAKAFLTAPAPAGAAALPSLTIPDSCGPFRREGHSLDKQPMFGDTPMQTGASRRRRLYLATPRLAGVSLEVTQAGLADFVSWFENALGAGTAFFSAQVANQGPGTLWYKARVSGSIGQKPYSTEFLGGSWWRITMKLVLFGEGSTVSPAQSSALTGGATFALTGSASLTVLQPLSGGCTFALLPVTAAAGGVLAGGCLLALLAGVYFPPAPVGSAAGTSTATGVSATGYTGTAAGSSTVSGVPINPSVGSAAGFGNAIAAAITQGLTYPDEKGTWVASSGALTVGVNDIPIYFLRARVLVGVSIVTLGGVGSCQLDVYKVPIGSYPPSSANSICAAAKPVITAAKTYVDTTLTGWTKAFAAGDVAVLHVDATSVFTLIAIKLHFRET